MSSKAYIKVFSVVMLLLLTVTIVVSCKGLHFTLSHNITLKVDRDKREPIQDLKDTVYIIDTVSTHK